MCEWSVTYTFTWNLTLRRMLPLFIMEGWLHLETFLLISHHKTSKNKEYLFLQPFCEIFLSFLFSAADGIKLMEMLLIVQPVYWFFFFFPLLQRFKCSVYRRYNDFVVFHEMLLQKFPYRMVPALPPKRMLGGKFGSLFCLEVLQCEYDQDETNENKYLK